MWGQEWGAMIWGQVVPITKTVPIAPLALLLLGVSIGISALKWRASNTAKLFLLSLVVGFPTVGVIATTLQHQFVNGTVADADEVNANFTALEQQLGNQLSSLKVAVTSNGVSSLTLQSIDQPAFAAICGDSGGCTVRLCYSGFNNPTDDAANLANCQSERLIGYDEASGKWKAGTYSDTSFTFSTSADNNGAVSNLASLSSCAINDADIINPVFAAQDISVGFSISNSQASAGFTCTATFHD